MCQIQKFERLSEVNGPVVQVRQVVAVQPQELQVPLAWWGRNSLFLFIQPTNRDSEK
jgi:hypothetical protein